MTRRSLAAAAIAIAVVISGCGGGNDIRNFLGNTYPLQNSTGDIATYTSTAPVGVTTSRIANAVSPATRAADGGSEYLRYNDDVAIVSPAPGGGSTVRVEDLDGRYRNGFFTFLGPGFNPGSPAGGYGGSGGPGDIK